MTASRHTDRDDPPITVRQVALAADARALSTLARIDYADAFIVRAGVERTPQQWTRAVLQDAPLAVRAQLRAGWMALGLTVTVPGFRRQVLGWTVQRSDPAILLLTAGSRFGLHGQLLFHSQPDGLLFATFIQLHNPAARVVWARITTHHQRVVQSLLTHAARREARGVDGEPVHPQPVRP